MSPCLAEKSENEGDQVEVLLKALGIQLDHLKFTARSQDDQMSK
jgi:hypothetical protein